MIIPSDYKYQEIKQVLVPCDLNAIQSINKINIMRSTPQWKNVKLLVLNVDPNDRHLQPDEKFRQSEKNVHHYLENFEHEIFYVANKNVIGGILNYNKINEVQLIIALPGSYSFLYSLTHRSVSQALYRNSKLPVLILK